MNRSEILPGNKYGRMKIPYLIREFGKDIAEKIVNQGPTMVRIDTEVVDHFLPGFKSITDIPLIEFSIRADIRPCQAMRTVVYESQPAVNWKPPKMKSLVRTVTDFIKSEWRNAGNGISYDGPRG